MLRITLTRRRIQVATAILAIVVPIVTFGTLRTGSTQNSATGPAGTLEVELITLRPDGFEPSEITRPKDQFVLFIDDRSGREDTSLVLQRVQGERVKDVKINRKKSEWYNLLDLAPGTYVLHDTGNPELQCQITILP
jgi:hypothetical protein